MKRFPFSFVRLVRSSAALASALFFAVPVGAVGTRYFVLESAKDFSEGEAKGVFVDARGHLRPGFRLTSTSLADAAQVWATLQTKDGLLLATGNDGALFRYRAGKTERLAATDALALTSLTGAWNRTFAGSFPGARIFEWTGGQLKEFVKLDGGEHIWALAHDPKSDALFAATGPEGKLYRIPRDGKAQVHFDAEESHLVSLAVAADGTVYVGSSGKARIYKVTGPGRASILHDFGSTEVRALAVGASGDVYAIANELKSGGRVDSWKADRPAPAKGGDGLSGSGELHVFDKNGRSARLYVSKDEPLASLAIDRYGRALVGTANQGRVYRTSRDLDTVMVADLDERQVSAIRMDGEDSGVIIGSDPANVHEIESLGSLSGTYTSAALDAGLRADFGKIRYEASPGVEIRTRTGNSAVPGLGWSDWSAPLENGAQIASPGGRFLQFKVVMPPAQDRKLWRVEIPFRTDNLRPILTGIRVESPSAPKGSRGLKASGGPVEGNPSTKLKVTFDVENPDEDELRYKVEYRHVDSYRWLNALEPSEVLTKNSFQWETASLPEGYYRLRATVSDELANPPSEAQSHSLESQLILVDNTPPRIEQARLEGKVLRARVRDGLGPVTRIEVRFAGSPEWFPVGAEDGIFDSAIETTRADLSSIWPGDPAFLTLRAYDAANNSALEIVTVPR